MTATSATTFVLVHGAWHGGWCWQRVVDRLTRAGHTVHAPTLTGVGERSHLSGPHIDLSTHVADVVHEVLWKDLHRIVLCGHSYGGMVITGAAEHLERQIATLVYLDAFLPGDGESINDLVGAAMPTNGYLAGPITAEQFNVNETDRAWVDAKMTPQSAACFAERPKLTGAALRVPRKTYIRAAGFPMPHFQANYERLAKTPGWRTHLVDCGHDVMIDRPAALAELLLSAALADG